MSSPVWCITARNRMTGEREVVTPPIADRKVAEDLKMKYGYRNHCKAAYTNPKVEVYHPDMFDK